MMPSEDARKRKACQSCTRAKAKCSPSQHGLDVCYRCDRLNKECVFEEAAKKKVPKQRSRVKQLEQRVDTLIDLLASNGQTTSTTARDDSGNSRSEEPRPQPAIILHTPEARNVAPIPGQEAPEDRQESMCYITPAETPDRPALPDAPFETYDPIAAKVISSIRATTLLNEFRKASVLSFPFVVVPPSATVDSLRKESPFLFHAIMAVMTYATPSVQGLLAQEIKNQIGARIIARSHKSLDILQGLLVYVAWYHLFYRPMTQQLSITLQLCVALIQDLGISKNPKDKERKMTLTEEQSGLAYSARRSAAEKRAFLGAYCLTVSFSQAWRKRNTMVHTRYMAQCYQSLSSDPEYPTDRLIAPLVRLSELVCRVNDYFSYDDIENADVKGEGMLEMSTTNFRGELEQIRDSIPAAYRQNMTLILKLQMLEMWIHESSLHSSLWNTNTTATKPIPTFSSCRVKMLYRTMYAMKAYFNTLINSPTTSLYQLGFASWAGWFYANVVACKLVFLLENERQNQSGPEGMQTAISTLLPECVQIDGPAEFCALPQGEMFWDPVTVAKEAEVRELFERMLQKMQFACRTGEEMDCEKPSGERDPLFSVPCLQTSLLNGFNKRMKEYIAQSRPKPTSPPISNPDSNPNNTQIPCAGLPNHQYRCISTGQNDHTQCDMPMPLPLPRPGLQADPHSLLPNNEFLQEAIRENPIPFINSLNWSSLNFESLPATDVEGLQGVAGDAGPMRTESGGVGDVAMYEHLPPLQNEFNFPMLGPVGQETYEDMMWDVMMEDFTMPPM